MPTLLELASIDAPPGLSGRSLIPLIHGEPSGERSLWSEYLSGESRGNSLRRGHWNVHDLPGGGQAFDIASDPSEDHVLSAPEPLLEELRSFGGRFTVRAPEMAVIDERSLEHLRELGYIGGFAPRLTLQSPGVRMLVPRLRGRSLSDQHGRRRVQPTRVKVFPNHPSIA